MKDVSKADGSEECDVWIKEEQLDGEQLVTWAIKDEAEGECISSPRFPNAFCSDVDCAEKEVYNLNSTECQLQEPVERLSSGFTQENHQQRSNETIETHNAGETPISCPYCHYRSNHPNYLRSHILSKHHKYKPYSCPFCNYRSNQTDNLKSHINFKHSFEKPYYCSQCSYRSSQSSNLTRHMRLKHSNFKTKLNCPKEKPFLCPYCDYRCSQSGNLKSHITFKHSKVKPHACPFCIYKTPMSSNLRRHITLKHSLERYSQNSISYFNISTMLDQSHLSSRLDQRSFEKCNSRSQNVIPAINENTRISNSKPEMKHSSFKVYSTNYSSLNDPKLDNIPSCLQGSPFIIKDDVSQSGNSSELGLYSHTSENTSVGLVQGQIFDHEASGIMRPLSRDITPGPLHEDVQLHSELPFANMGHRNTQKQPNQTDLNSNLNFDNLLSSNLPDEQKSQHSSIENKYEYNAPVSVKNEIIPPNSLRISSTQCDFFGNIKDGNNSVVFDRTDCICSSEMKILSEMPTNIGDTQNQTHSIDHQVKVLKSKDKLYECPFCAYTSLLPGNMNSHIAFKHTKVKPFCCPFCTYRSCLSSNVKRHITLKHFYINPFSCETENTASTCKGVDIIDSRDHPQDTFQPLYEKQSIETNSSSDTLPPAFSGSLRRFNNTEPQIPSSSDGLTNNIFPPEMNDSSACTKTKLGLTFTRDNVLDAAPLDASQLKRTKTREHVAAKCTTSSSEFTKSSISLLDNLSTTEITSNDFNSLSSSISENPGFFEGLTSYDFKDEQTPYNTISLVIPGSQTLKASGIKVESHDIGLAHSGINKTPLEHHDIYNQNMNSRTYCNLRPYRCPYCKYRSSQSGNLKKHIDFRHFKVKPFGCPYCKYRSSQSSNVKRHLMLRHHSLSSAKTSVSITIKRWSSHKCYSESDIQSPQNDLIAAMVPSEHSAEEHYLLSSVTDQSNSLKQEILSKDTIGSNFVEPNANLMLQAEELKSVSDNIQYSNKEAGPTFLLQNKINMLGATSEDEQNINNTRKTILDAKVNLERQDQRPHDLLTSQSSNLKAHIGFTHSKVKPFGCLYCSYCSSQSSNVKRHIRLRHQMELTAGSSAFKESHLNVQNSYSDTMINSKISASEFSPSQHLSIKSGLNMQISFEAGDDSSSIVKQEITKDSFEEICSDPSVSPSHKLKHLKSELDDVDNCPNYQEGTMLQISENPLEVKCVPSSEEVPETMELNTKKHQCPFCDHKTLQPNNLKTHIAFKHSKVKPFNCPYCHYQSSQSSNVKRHVRLKHSVELSASFFKASFVESQKSTKTHNGISALPSESLVHQSETQSIESHTSSPSIPHEISSSSLDYLSSKTGIEMSSIHSKICNKSLLYNEKRYCCPYCDHRCSQLGNLKTHISCKHSIEKRYNCLHCNYKTSHSSNMKRHVILKHKK